jgi:hypothetical protein
MANSFEAKAFGKEVCEEGVLGLARRNEGAFF